MNWTNRKSDPGDSSSYFNAKSYPHSETSKSLTSHLFTGWLRKQSTRSTSVTETESGIRGQFFPAKLAMALGMAKCLLGLVIIAFGVLALWEQAAMSNLGSGLWCGAVVFLSGLMGIMAGKKKSSLVYIISYLITSILALAVTGLLLIFAASGLARDSDSPLGYFIDEEEGNPVEFLGTVSLRQRPIIVNAVLVAMGTLDAIFSLASIFICIRETCLCYHPNPLSKATSVPNMNLLTADQSPEGQARAYRLLRWLGQHRPPPAPVHSHPPRLYNPPVPMMAPVTGAIPVPSFATGAPTAYVIPSVLPSMIAALPTIGPYAGYAPFYSLSIPSLYSSDLQVNQSFNEETTRPTKVKRKRKKNRKTETSDTLSIDKKTIDNGQDDNVSFIYTGLDREIAEEFILHSMEPSKSMAYTKTNEADA